VSARLFRADCVAKVACILPDRQKRAILESVLAELGFGGVGPEATDRPSYHPSVLLKLYIYLSSTYTAISIGFSLAGGSSVKLLAIVDEVIE
jgi:hypothetical protein